MCSEKVLFWKFREISRKTSFVEFLLKKSNCPIYHKLYWKMTLQQMFSLSLQGTLFKLLRECLWWWIADEPSSFYNPAENIITCIAIFRIFTRLEISRCSLLTRATGLQSTSCNATKKKFLTKILKSVSNISKKFQEDLYNGLHF